MDFPILKDIVIIFSLSTLVNLVFTRIKIPTIIGYLLTGIIAGPYLLSIIHSPLNIEVMAEIGVILLMFTIGLEFSLHHLMRIRRIVLWGGFIQMSLTVGIVFLIVHFSHLEKTNALFFGFLVALSSTAIVLKVLQDRSELSSNCGRTILGILIFQDIIVITLLLFVPILSGEIGNLPFQLFVLFLKTVFIIVFVYVTRPKKSLQLNIKILI